MEYVVQLLETRSARHKRGGTRQAHLTMGKQWFMYTITMYGSVHISFLVRLLPALSPLQPQFVLWCVCCLWPGPWSSMPEPVHSSDQDTYR